MVASAVHPTLGLLLLDAALVLGPLLPLTDTLADCQSVAGLSRCKLGEDRRLPICGPTSCGES
jgi:hypothetical protein